MENFIEISLKKDKNKWQLTQEVTLLSKCLKIEKTKQKQKGYFPEKNSRHVMWFSFSKYQLDN